MSAMNPAAGGTVLDELAQLPARLKASAQRLADLVAQEKLERKTRDRLVREAVDQAGLPQAVVARAAEISQPHVVRILAGGDQ